MDGYISQSVLETFPILLYFFRALAKSGGRPETENAPQIAVFRH